MQKPYRPISAAKDKAREGGKRALGPIGQKSEFEGVSKKRNQKPYRPISAAKDKARGGENELSAR
jgi:hypothetical protein